MTADGRDATATLARGELTRVPSDRGALVHTTVEPQRLEIGRYLVIAEIGRGGMGVVLRAYDPRLQREVALKLVRTHELSAQAQARLLREAQAMAQLSHPNVVGVYDVEFAGDEVAIAMEHVRGTTLRAWLAGQHRWQDVLALFIAAGNGLAAAHAAGLLHRDFKPANVLVGDDGRPRVTDFGLAEVHDVAPSSLASGQANDELTQVGTILGTPRYMAPEQHDGLPLDPSADQYALCVALWEGLTGSAPFFGDDYSQLVEAKRRGQPSWPRAVIVPGTIRDALRRGLAPLPSDRWPTMHALLERLATGARFGQRHRPWIIAGGALATLGGVATVAMAVRDARLQRCSGAEVQLADVWHDERRASAERAFVESGAPEASSAWRELERRLDDYASAWAAMHTDACAATTIRQEQPATVMDLRMGCLHRARVDLGAVAELLARADAQVVAKARQVVDALPDLSRCADIEALQTEVPPPDDANAAAVESIRVELAKVKALREAGKYAEILQRTRALAPRAAEVSYAPVRSEVLLELAMAWELNSDFRAAESLLRQALRSALASRQWSIAQIVAMRLIYIVGSLQVRPLEGLAYAQTAKGLVSFGDESSTPDLRGIIAQTLDTLGRHAEAEIEHRAALAAAMAYADDATIATYRGNLGGNLLKQGRLAEAEQEISIQLAMREKEFEPGHPGLAHARLKLARLALTQGHFADAEKQSRALLERWENILGVEHVLICAARMDLASAMSGQGRAEEAVSEYRAVLRVLRQSGPGDFATLLAQGGLAAALANLGRHDEAEVEVREALRLAEKIHGAEHPHTAGTRTILVLVLLGEKRHEEAELEARKALAAFATNPSDANVPLLHNRLGKALHGQRRYAEAETHLRTALASGEKTFGRSSAHVAQIQRDLLATLEAQGRHDEAESLRQWARNRSAVESTP